MTYHEFMKYYDPEIKAELAELILWEMTCFPLGGLKTITKQIRSAIRCINNHIKVCDLCGLKKPFHKQGCLNKIETHPKTAEDE